MSRLGTYGRILERLFFSLYEEGTQEMPFDVSDLARVA